MKIQTSDKDSYQSLIEQFKLPESTSHKGQNGKVMIIGGSPLFHSASLWAAEIASHFVDMVHYASTEENNAVFLSLKKIFRNGIIVHQKDIHDYVKEDDAILIGPGMERGDMSSGKFTQQLTQDLLSNFPDKQFVLDAGALQMMELSWLVDLKHRPILTPHQFEFEKLFGTAVHSLPHEERVRVVKDHAERNRCIILLKGAIDIVSDGRAVYTIEGGNAGLTKGGTGDVLSGLIVSLLATQKPLFAAVMASILEKKAADQLFNTKGIWYNVADLIDTIPTILKNLIYN